MDKKTRFFEAARQRLMYALSLPERTIRSLAALAGGTSTLLAEMLFPESLRGTTTYNVTIGMMQQFIIERVAGMASEIGEDRVNLGDNYVQRKMAGTALEAAGLLMMGYSPLWVLAIAGDTAGGSKVFLNRLVEHLKENGIVAEETKVAGLVDVLEAVQEASSKSANTFDAPPLSRVELSNMADEMKVSYGQVFKSTTNLIPWLDAIWKNMEQLARRENISIERLGGIMTMDAVSWSKKGASMALAAGQTGAELFDEKILDSYRQTLAAASEQGVDKYISDHMRPFMQSARAHFDSTQKTWTGSKLEGGSNTRGVD
ncbi:MAG: hypothetical protein WBB65_03375 [Anaerolineales bacterium]